VQVAQRERNLDFLSANFVNRTTGRRSFRALR
jgi:hypothetical protein